MVARMGLYFAAVAFLLYLILPWKSNYEAMIRIEPELSTTGESTSIEAEMEVVQAWGTISQAVQQMQRTVVVEPRRSMWLFHIGYYFDYIFSSLTNSPIEEFVNYQPSLQLQNFIITGPEADSEYQNKRFVLTVGEKNTYALFNEDGAEIIRGKVGTAAKANLDKAGKYKLEILVSGINASPDESFNITPVDIDSFINEIERNLNVDRKGFRERSGLMMLSYSNSDPAFAKQVLETIINVYMSQAYDRSSLGKINGAARLEAQSVTLRQQVASADRALAQFKSENQIVDIPQDQDFEYKRSLEINDELAKVNLEYKAASVSLTDSHPIVAELLNKSNFLQNELSQLNSRLENLPQKQQELNELKRNVDVAQGMLDQNTELTAKLRAEVETITGYANLISLHSPDNISAALRGVIVLILGFIAGSMLAISWLIYQMSPGHEAIANGRDSGVADILPVVANLPILGSGITALLYSKYPAKIVKTEQEWNILASSEIEYLEHESQFLLLPKSNKILLFADVGNSSAASFCARQLAILGAKTSKTLIIDANIMKPSAHSALGDFASHPGFADVLIGKADIAKAIKPTNIKNVFLLPAGTQTSNFHLLSNMQAVANALAKISPTFERIIIEFPTLTPGICKDEILKIANAVFIVAEYNIPSSKLNGLLKACGVDKLKSAFLIFNKK